MEFIKPDSEENVMADSSLNATEIAVGSLLAGGNRGGYGSGGAWGGGSSEGVFASPTSNAVRINSAARANASGIENLLDQNQFSATNKNIVDGDARICDKLSDNANRAADATTAAEFRMNDRLRDVEREMGQNAKDAAKCCCDAQLAACQSHAELMAAVLSENSKTRELMQATALDTANARVIQLETVAALRNGNGNG